MEQRGTGGCDDAPRSPYSHRTLVRHHTLHIYFLSRQVALLRLGSVLFTGDFFIVIMILFKVLFLPFYALHYYISIVLELLGKSLSLLTFV